jgi:hypothetical protein
VRVRLQREIFSRALRILIFHLKSTRQNLERFSFRSALYNDPHLASPLQGEELEGSGLSTPFMTSHLLLPPKLSNRAVGPHLLFSNRKSETRKGFRTKTRSR